MPLPSRRPADAVQTDAVFRILTVCTGNLCRSPQAEQLLRTRIPAALGTDVDSALEVTSAGTMAYDGDPMDVLAAAEAVRLGVEDAQQHRARRIRAQHVVGADLILGMAREHRGAAASLAPTANRRVFTLVEFARITESLAAGDFDVVPPTLAAGGFPAFMRGVVDLGSRLRGVMPTLKDPGGLDIDDPYRQGPDVYRRSADSVELHVERLAVALRALAEAGAAGTATHRAIPRAEG